MIVDTHAHVFPPAVRDRRSALFEIEPGFAEIYTAPSAAMATADELLASMDESGVERAVIVNFAWRTEALVDETNEYIMEAAVRSGGRLIPFVSVYFGENAGAHGRAETEEAPSLAPGDVRTKLRKLAAAGARGIGELRPRSSGYNLANSDEADVLAWAAQAYDLPLLCHVSEPVGHAYPGKEGLPLGELYAFARAANAVTLIGAHWGGGMPFYLLMPEVRDALENLYFDTAASQLLYDARVFRSVIDLAGVSKVLWGSDHPLISQSKALAHARSANLSEEELEAILGGNAARVLGLL